MVQLQFGKQEQEDGTSSKKSACHKILEKYTNMMKTISDYFFTYSYLNLQLDKLSLLFLTNLVKRKDNYFYRF